MKKKYLFGLLMTAIGVTGVNAQDNVFDTSMTASGNVTVYETESNNANGKAEFMKIKNSGTSNTIASFFKFDLSNIPENADVLEVGFEFRANLVSTFANIRIRVMEESWSEGDADPNDVAAGEAASQGDVTWDYADYDNTPWSGGNARNAWSNSTPAVAQATIDQNNPIIKFPAVANDSANIISMVQNWVSDPSSNHGIALFATGATHDVNINSRHASNNRPELYIKYQADPPTSVEDHTSNISDVNVFPNPAVNTLNISGLSNSVERIEILDLSGRVVDVVSTNTVNETAVTVNLNAYNSGTFLLRVSDKENVSVNKFVVK